MIYLIIVSTYISFFYFFSECSIFMLAYTSVCGESRPQLVEMSTRRSTGQLATCVSMQVFQNNFGRFCSSCINSNCNCKNNCNCNGGLDVQWRRRQVEDLTFVTIALLMNCTNCTANCQLKDFYIYSVAPPSWMWWISPCHTGHFPEKKPGSLVPFFVFQKKKSPRSLTWFTWKKHPWEAGESVFFFFKHRFRWTILNFWRGTRWAPYY